MLGLLFGLIFGGVAALVAFARWQLRKNCRVGFLFRPYIICSCALGAMIAVSSMEVPTCSVMGTAFGDWLILLWSPLSLIVSFMTARRYCWLPFSYVFGLALYCCADSFLIDLPEANSAISGLGCLLGTAFLLASLYTYFDLQVNISSRIAKTGSKLPLLGRINSMSILGGIMVVLLAIVGVTYGFLVR